MARVAYELLIFVLGMYAGAGWFAAEVRRLRKEKQLVLDVVERVEPKLTKLAEDYVAVYKDREALRQKLERTASALTRSQLGVQ